MNSYKFIDSDRIIELVPGKKCIDNTKVNLLWIDNW